MTDTVTWEDWSAAEQQWKADHPIAGRGKGWRQRMLSEISGQFGGAGRPTPPRDPDMYVTAECEACDVELMRGSCPDEPFAEVESCPNCGRCYHDGYWHGEPGI